MYGQQHLPYMCMVKYAHIWTSLVIGHIAIIFAAYYTFKQFHNIQQNKYKWGYHSYGRGVSM